MDYKYPPIPVSGAVISLATINTGQFVAIPVGARKVRVSFVNGTNVAVPGRLHLSFANTPVPTLTGTDTLSGYYGLDSVHLDLVSPKSVGGIPAYMYVGAYVASTKVFITWYN